MALSAAARCLSSNLRQTVRVLHKCKSFKPMHSNITFSRPITIGSTLFSDKKFSRDHEWILMDGDSGTMGITDYAQEKLGEIVYIELPEVGSTFEMDEVFGAVESVKAASDIMSPVSCEITEVNTQLETDPGIVNKDSFGEGWMVKLKLSNPSELDELLSEEEYNKFKEECD